MFFIPIIIVGAPRSGTSLLQKLIRDHPAFVSVAKESDIIWSRYCHPSLIDWKSDECSDNHLNEETIAHIREEFAAYALPANLWQNVDRLNIVRYYRRYPLLSYFMRHGYRVFARLQKMMRSNNLQLRLVDKSVNHAFRLNFVNKVFPDAKYIYIKRDGRTTINSLINGWRDPARFFTYQLPVKLEIPNYAFQQWNFVLPPGWRDYINKPLEEVVAFQWCAIHNAILEEFTNPIYQHRVLEIKLEELSTAPQKTLQKISEFIELPWSSYFQNQADNLPIVNSSYSTINFERWHDENKAMIERIEPLINETMKKLGYDNN